MNRAERRKYAKAMKKMGANTEEISRMNNMLKTENQFAEGTKVKLNYEKITSQTDYGMRVENFRNFVEENKDTVFTVEYENDKAIKGRDQFIVTFKEDPTTPKWLWYVDDLIAVEKVNK